MADTNIADTNIADDLPLLGLTPTLPPTTTTPAIVGSLGNGPGKVVDMPVGLEPFRQQFGLERLFRWFNLLKSGNAATVALVGDSNTAGYAGQLLQSMLAQLPSVTVTNYGVGGSTLKQWIDGTGGFASSGSMTAVLATQPTLICMMFGGTNTPSVDAGGSPSTFAADLETALSTMRAGVNGTVGARAIALFTSAAQSDGITNAGTAFKRDMEFNALVRPIIAAAANKYKCAYFDRNGLFPDAMVDFTAGSPLVDNWLDTNRVHTMFSHTDMLAQAMFEFLVPSFYRISSQRINVLNSGTSTLVQPGNTENMSTKRHLSHVYLEGRMNCAARTIPLNLSLFSIASAHRPRIQVWNAMCQLFDGTTPMTPIRVNIQTDGQVIAAEASALNVTSIRMRADWECVGYN